MNDRSWRIISVFLFLLLFHNSLAWSQSISADDFQFFMGNKNAKVVLLEFADYQCPFCGRFHRETFPQIDKNYIATGKVKFVFRNFPLEKSHPDAFKAAETALCAGEQGAFWAMHNRLFASQGSGSFNDWTKHAQALGLNLDSFTRCLDSDATAAKIKKDVADAKSVGVKVTPTFLLGVIDPGTSQLKIFDKIEGAQDYATFKKALDNVIANAD